MAEASLDVGEAATGVPRRDASDCIVHAGALRVETVDCGWNGLVQSHIMEMIGRDR
jgi:hypothetical protein